MSAKIPIGLSNGARPSMRRRIGLLLVPICIAVAVASFVVARDTSETEGEHAVPEAGLSDDERRSLHSTAVAETAKLIKNDAREFARSGLSLDLLPRADIESSSVMRITDPHEAVGAAELIVEVESLGSYVDESDARLYSRLTVLDTVKGEAPKELIVGLGGGPRKSGEGSWLLVLQPQELYLHEGQRAILFLNSKDGVLRQRPFQGILIEDGLIAPRSPFAFQSTLAGRPSLEVLAELKDAVR